MNKEAAYEVIKNSLWCTGDKAALKKLVDALASEPEPTPPKPDPGVEVGAFVTFKSVGLEGVGEVCYVDEYSNIRVGFPSKIKNIGVEYNHYSSVDGSDYAKSRGYKYGWYVNKCNYTVISRGPGWEPK